jgi:hypothetical protein
VATRGHAEQAGVLIKLLRLCKPVAVEALHFTAGFHILYLES